MLTDDERKKIVQIFLQKAPNLKCPMCQNSHFTLGDGYFSNMIQPKLSTFTVGGPSIPSIPIICNNCGFISQHALGVLGLLPEEKAKPETK